MVAEARSCAERSTGRLTGIDRCEDARSGRAETEGQPSGTAEQIHDRRDASAHEFWEVVALDRLRGNWTRNVAPLRRQSRRWMIVPPCAVTTFLAMVSPFRPRPAPRPGLEQIVLDRREDARPLSEN